MPYTYLIGWTNLNKWYYGCRYADGCSSDDLWKTYFTSSKYVFNFRKENGEPDIIKIRKVFDCKIDSLEWEGRVLRKLWNRREHWLNRKFDSTKYIIDKDTIQSNILSKKNRSSERQEEIVKNISAGSKQGHRNRNNETKKRVSNLAKEQAKNRPESVNIQISESVKKIIENRSDEEWQKIEGKKAKTRKKNKDLGNKRKMHHMVYCSCLHCFKLFDPGNWSKHVKLHFERENNDCKGIAEKEIK